jgi:hypothetical protein
MLPPGSYRHYNVFISHAWDYNDDYDGIVNLLNVDRSFVWTNLSVPIEAPLKMTLFLKKSYRGIVRQLDERIALADCVLVLAAMYFKDRGWIQSEIEAALEFGKPIIAISPRGQERFPSDLEQIAEERVGWTSKSIIDAIRRRAAM